MLGRFGELFSKKLQTVAHFSKKNEKSSIWPKLATFRGNNHVSAFWSTFQQKVAKSSSFRENARKIIDFAKTCNFSRNYHVSAFWWTFQQKVAKSGSFRPEARKIIDLPKTCNSSTKLPCFGVLVKEKVFQQKVAKSLRPHFRGQFFSKLQRVAHFVRKHWTTHRFGQKLQLFQQTTMFPRFG